MDRLCLGLRIQLAGHLPDDARLESEFSEDAADFLNGHRRLIKVQIHDVVIAIDLIAQARDSLELVVEFQDFFQIADTRSVNL